MCLTCTLAELTGLDGGTILWNDVPWPKVSDEMKLLARLRWALYECTSAITGGPMHIFTDDYNASDGNIAFCRKEAEGDHWSSNERDWPLIQAISLRMCDLAEPMSPGERLTAISLSWGEIGVDHDGRIVRRRNHVVHGYVVRS